MRDLILKEIDETLTEINKLNEKLKELKIKNYTFSDENQWYKEEKGIGTMYWKVKYQSPTNNEWIEETKERVVKRNGRFLFI